MRLCTIDGCTHLLRARGMCATHWRRWRTHGDPRRVISPAERAKAPEARFWAKVDKNAASGCWIWTGAIADTGYGIFNFGASGTSNTHRISYRWLVGPIPDGMHLDHLCRVRACCNPAHLEPVAPVENSRRGKMIGYDHPNAPTTCGRGHDWAVWPPYLAHRADGTVTRRCRPCAYQLELSRKWQPGGVA